MRDNKKTLEELIKLKWKDYNYNNYEYKDYSEYSPKEVDISEWFKEARPKPTVDPEAQRRLQVAVWESQLEQMDDSIIEQYLRKKKLERIGKEVD